MSDETSNVSGKPALSPEEARKAAAATEAMAATFGRVVALLIASPRHRKLKLEDVGTMLMPAIALGQYAVVGAKAQKDGPVSIAAAVWWAFVSPEVDKRLSESRDEFLKLSASEWNCGDLPWVIEAIGEQKILNEMVKRIASRKFKGKPAKLRALMPDGKVAVGSLEPSKPGAPKQPG